MASLRTSLALALVAALAPLSVAHAQQPVFGVHVAGPTRASASVGVWLGEDPRHDAASGAVLLVEPGLRGGRASIGYAYALRGGFGSFVTARATALRTWRSAGPPHTYAGGEVQVLPLLAVGPRLGAFVPTRGPRRMLWILDVGLGL
jgi:hypothetical protein